MGLAWLLPSSSPTFSIFTRKCCLRKFHFMAKATSLAWQTDPQNDFPRLWGNINFNLPVFQFNVAINKIPLFNRCFQCKAIFLLEVVIKFYLWPIAKIKLLCVTTEFVSKTTSRFLHTKFFHITCSCLGSSFCHPKLFTCHLTSCE